MPRRIKLSQPVRGIATEEESRQIDELEELADREIGERVAAEQRTHTTTVKWTGRQLATIQRAAARFGMPYQTYVKDAAFRRALQDLADANRVGA